MSIMEAAPTTNHKSSGVRTHNLMNQSSSNISDISLDVSMYPPPKKTVRFAPTARVRKFKSVANDDSMSTWYSIKDYKRFQRDRAIDCDSVRGRDIYTLKDDECFWGLENSIVPDMRQNIFLLRSHIVKGVLNEQKSQQLNGMANLGSISRASSIYSDWSATVAHKKALFYSISIKNSQQISDLRLGGSAPSV